LTTLVVGASGATGRRIVEELLNRGQDVKIVVRSLDSLPEILKRHSKLSVIEASVLDLSDTEMAQHVRGCEAVASCLGHNMSFKGLFGAPRRLVIEVTHRLCNAIKQNETSEPVKFVLMNTAGNSNRDLNEPISFSQKCLSGFSAYCCLRTWIMRRLRITYALKLARKIK